MGEKRGLLVKLVVLTLGLTIIQAPANAAVATIVANSVNYASGAGNSSVIPTFTYTATGTTGAVSCYAYPNGTTTSNYGSATPVTVGPSLAAGTYPIICSGTAAAGNTGPTLTAGTLTVQAGAAFTCTANFYQFSSGVSSGTAYYVWRLAPSGSSFTFAGISGAGTTALNAAGWNPTDNYIYALASTNLYRVDANGQQTNLGAITAATGATINNTGGDFVTINGTAYLLNHATTSNFDLVNIATLQATKVTATGATWGAYDGTVIKNSVMYGLVGGTGTTGTLDIATLLTDGNPANESITVTTKSVSGLTGATASDSYGAAYSDASGNVYFYGNGSLKLYEITAAELQKSAPTAVLITTSTSAIKSPNDGASCPKADSPTAPTVTTSASVSSITTTGAQVAGTIFTPNLTGSNVVSGQLQFCYATTQILLSSSPTCISSTPDTATVNETVTPISANFTGLSPGTVYYFQAKATNASGSTASGAIQSFTTLRTWTVTSNNASYTIGGTVPTLSGTASPAGTVGTCLAYTNSGLGTLVTINSSLAAGTYVIHCTGTAASGYATTPTYVDASLQVTTQMSWTITANNASYTPGGSIPSITGSASPSAGLSGSLTCAAYTNRNYTATVTINASLAVGTYPTHCTGTAAAGYAAASLVDGILTVSTTPWTLTAQNAGYTVGGSVPTLSAAASPSGALNGSATCNVYTTLDTLFQSPLIISASMGQGSYVIRCTGTPNTGYDATPTIVTATLTVTTLTTWTLTASSGTYAFGGSAPSITATASPSGGLSGSATCRAYTDNTYVTQVTLNTSTAVGTYITHCTGTGASGYTSAPTYIDGTVSVTALTWSITASAGSYSIGGSVPSLTGTASPGGALSGSLSCLAYTSADTSYSNALTISTLSVGTYVIHCTGTPASGYSSSPTIADAALTVSSLFIVSFDTNTALSGSPSVLSVTQASAGAAVTLATVGTMAKTGYHFRGWGLNRSDTSTIASTYTPASSITVYAIWAIDTFTITFDANGGTITSGSSTAIVSYQGDAIPSAPVGVSNGAQSLVGWNTDSSSSSALSTYSVTSSVTLYAIWSVAPVLYTVSFNGNGESGGSPATASATQASAGASISLSTVGTLAKTGYSFGGWSLTGNAPAISGGTYTPARTLTLYAIWNINSYRAIFNANGGSITSGSDSSTVYYNADAIGVAPTVSYPYYHLSGWNTDSSTSTGLSTYSVTGDVTLYAIWAANYTVTFSPGGSASGSASTSSATQVTWGGNVALAAVGTMTWTGHTFIGWSSNGMAPTISGPNYTPGSSLTLYAVWSVNSYTVTYNAHGGALSGGGTTTTISYDYGSTNAVSSAPSVSYTLYNLVGWNTDSSSSVDIGSYTVTGPVTLYAIWSLAPVVYTVNFNSNSASGDPSPAYITQASTGASIALATQGTMSKAGYTFGGWSISGSAPALSGPNYTPTSSVTLYAIWSINAYQVTFNGNGGSFNSGDTVTTVSRNYNSDLIAYASSAITSETLTSYNFIGWNSDSSSASAFSTYLLGAAPVTLYAIWSNAPVVSFDCGVGCLVASIPYLGSGLTLPTPSKTGYTFTSWTTAPNGGGTTISSPYVPPANITLYALWTIKHYYLVFDAGTNGGEFSDSSSAVTAVLDFGVDAVAYATSHSLLPSAPDSTFLGWHTDQGQGSTLSTYIVDDSSETQTVYAIYLGTVTYTYSISYDGNGSTGGTPVATQSGASVSVTLSSNTFTRSGYTFVKWNTNTGGSGTNYTDGQSINLTTDISVTLFAQWSSNTPPPSGGGGITQTLPTITWQNPVAIYYPTSLSSTQLNASSGGIAGTWTYTPASGTILNPGSYTLRVLFTPTNGALYLVNTATVTLRVLERAKSNPVIRWADPLPIFEPTALSSAQLNAVCSVPGKLIYTPVLGTVLPAGVYALHVQCDPTEEEKYNPISYAVRLVVNTGSAGGLTPVVPPTPSTPTKKPTTPAEPSKGPQNPNPNIIVPVDTLTSSMVVTYPEAPGIGIKTATIENSTLVSSAELTFSGKTTVSVTLVNNGETQTILVPVVVLPAAAVSPVAQPNTFLQGQVQWTPVENATGYQVSIRGKVVCQTSETICAVPQTVGPATPVTVTSLGNDNTANPTLASVVVPKALPALTVHFASNSALLTTEDKSQLRQIAKAIKSEGFTQVILQGHTDSVGGVDNYALSKARAASTQAYLGKLVPNVTFAASALADKVPVAENTTVAGKAQNRRTEVLVR